MPALKEPELLPRNQAHARGAGRLFDPGGRRTLDDLVVGLIEDASQGRAPACPVCQEPVLSAEGEAVLACPACGSRLE